MNGIRRRTPLSQTVREIPYHAAAQNANQQIDQFILFPHNQPAMRFGETRPWHADEPRIFISPHLRKIARWLTIFILLLGISLGSIRLIRNTSPLVTKETPETNCPNVIIIKEEKECDCSKAVVENQLGAMIDDRSILSMTYDEANVQEMFKDTTAADDSDDSTCAIYDIFVYIFRRLCSLKDNIVSIIPKKIPSDFSSITDENQKAGLTSPTADVPSTNFQTAEELIEEDPG